jgi:basic membrane lipoprotein Med (substrate-binding protein (PBP1-ABC) superfamily)
MPLLAADTEFAMKWASLSTMLQEEGLRDPIKAYEYMNHFYVMEGNKRVSVMKYLGAVSIPGTVIRVVPKRTNTKENRLYYEFMNFYQYSNINYIYFTEPGSYKKLQTALGKKSDQMWTNDEKKEFHSFFIRFEKAYSEKCGANPPMTVSDAILVYLNIYPYEISRNHMPSNFKVNIAKSWEEFLVHQEEQAVELSMTPTADIKKNFLSKLFSSEPKTNYKIAFVHDKSAETSGWTYGHELGRLHLEQKFPDRIRTQAFFNVNTNDPAESTSVIEKAIADGNDIIFTTTPKLLNASLKAAVDHPEVKILNCSLNTTHPSIRAYYGRMYEAKFLMGAIAGAMVESDQIGYIADYPIYGMTANINAFALGAKMINPRAKIYLEWSTVKDQDIRENLKNHGVCFISDRDMIVPNQGSRQFGLYHENGIKVENMATPVWHWGKFYELLVRSVLSGSWKAYEPANGTKALNYWWGMSAGVIDVICSQNLPEGTKKLVNLLKDNICSGEFHPFSGLLYDQEGHVRHEDEKPMAPEEIITMNWLVDNVDGVIPTMEELTEEAKQIVVLQGVNKTEEDEIV